MSIVLPYPIISFEIDDFHGVKKTSVDNIPPNTQWIFLTGENGYGKTTILQALVLGLKNIGKSTNINSEIKTTKIDICHINIANNNPYFSQEMQFKHFVAYGSSRLNIQNDLTSNEAEGKSSQTYSIFNSDGVLLNIEIELKRLAFRDKFQDKFENIKSTLLNLMPHIKDIIVKEGKSEDIVFYIEQDENGKRYKEVVFSMLASGYKSIIAIVGDMMIRLFREQEDVNHPKDLEGIVIIDELDLHFHPNWQRKLPKLLSNAFPKIQFIVSTHSVIPFLGAPKNSLFLKVTRNEEDGIKVDKVDVDVKNLLPNTILTSPLFDFEKLLPESNEKIDDIHTEDSYKEIKNRKERRERLKEYEEANKKFSDEEFQ